MNGQEMTPPRVISAEVFVPFVLENGTPYATGRSRINITLDDDPVISADDGAVYHFRGTVELPQFGVFSLHATFARNLFADRDVITVRAVPYVLQLPVPPRTVVMRRADDGSTVAEEREAVA